MHELRPWNIVVFVLFSIIICEPFCIQFFVSHFAKKLMQIRRNPPLQQKIRTLYLMLSIPTDSTEILQQKSLALKQKQLNAIENCFTTFTQIIQRLLNKIYNPQNLDDTITEIHGFTDCEYKHAINNEKFPAFMKELTDAGFEIDFSTLAPTFQFITFVYYQYDYMDNPVKRIVVNGTHDDECSEDGECMVIVNK